MAETHEALTVVDLFCGAGGISLGFRRAGFRVLRAVDHWWPAVETYRANLGCDAHQEEISGATTVPSAAVLVGGPPCQGFSSAGRRRSDDRRNSSVSVFARLVAHYKPRAFVFENVEGFLTAGGGRFVFELLERVIAAGYRVDLRKLNAANFGVPQHRKRVLAIGGLGWDPRFPTSTHAAFGSPGAHLGNGFIAHRTPTVAEALRSLPPANGTASAGITDHTFEPLRDEDRTRARALRPGQRMRDLPEALWHDSYRRRAFRRVMDGTPTERRGGAPSGLRRLRADEPSKAITGGALSEFLHPTEDRSLTLRECATLQTFPTDFVFVGTRAEKAQLIGNAVPPLLAEIVAAQLRDDLLAAPRATEDGGALLNFIPTLSSGMSPALEDVTRRVRSHFQLAPSRQHRRLLWD